MTSSALSLRRTVPRGTRQRVMRCRDAVALGLTSCALMPAAATAADGDPLRAQQWNLDAINADAAHRVSIGAGAIIAVLDSGVQASHPDLTGRVIAGRDFIDGDQNPEDQHGHGTNVAGIIVARDRNGIGIKGAAPGADVLSIRVLDAQNRGDSGVLSAGINAAVAAGAAVINLSVNPRLAVAPQFVPGDPLVQAIEAAARAGVVVVASAGNDGVPLCNQPLLATKILCVGAINRSRQRSSYSNYGVRVDIVAPGGERQPNEAITSAQLGGGYSAMAGTSQATPHVAAAAALLVSLGLRGHAVIERLEQTATPLPNALQLGHGLVNMSAAVAGLGPTPAAHAPAAPPLAARTPARMRYSMVRRRGVRVVCTSPQPTICRVRVTRHGRVLARGSRRVRANTPSTIIADLTPTGRRTLRRLSRLVANVTVAGAGASVRRNITLAR